MYVRWGHGANVHQRLATSADRFVAVARAFGQSDGLTLKNATIH
jgi:hypothetical protein